MNNGLFYDRKSRYNSVDNTKIIFLTPTEIQDLDIGFNMEMFKSDEYNDIFPFLLDTLTNMVKETTIGDVNGSEIECPVENSDCKVFICIEINGELCKLQTEEWEITNNLRGLPKWAQVKTFQRLITEGQINLNDLAAEDIDNDVYKKLVINDTIGSQLCKEKIEKLQKIYEEQCKDKNFVKKKEQILSNM